MKKLITKTLRIIWNDGHLPILIISIFIIGVFYFGCKNNGYDYDYKELANKDSTIEIGMIKDSQKHGLWIKITPQGTILKTNYYLNGDRVGPYKLYYRNGQLKYLNYFKNGEFNGRVIAYYSDGQLDMKGYFKNGKQDSIWLYFTKEGKLDKKVRYKEGEQVEVIIDKNLIPPPPPKSLN